MIMTKFLVVNDPHTSSQPPMGRMESYNDDILDKLREAWAIAKRLKCDFILIPGDIHHRFRGRASMELLIQLLYLFKRAPCPVYAIAGNHDMSMEGAASLSRMPFGALSEAGAITWLRPQVIGDVVFIPRDWQPHIDTLPNIFKLKKAELALIEENPGKHVVMVAHSYILAPGGNRPYPYHDAAKLPTDKLDLLICAHTHEDEGIHKLPSGCWYANIGSLARIDRTKHNLERTPEVLSVTLGKGEPKFERYPLTKARPASEVFFEQEVVAEREVGDFLAALNTALELEETPFDELIAEVTKGQPQKVADRLRHYLTEVGE